MINQCKFKVVSLQQQCLRVLLNTASDRVLEKFLDSGKIYTKEMEELRKLLVFYFERCTVRDKDMKKSEFVINYRHTFDKC